MKSETLEKLRLNYFISREVLSWETFSFISM